MTGAMLRGLNWGHRRATGPMAAASAMFTQETAATIAWDVQTLHGFEEGLSAALVAPYDLVVFDHPFCGAVARAGLFRPLETVLTHVRAEDFIGHSLDSYRFGGHLFALPVDAATQVALSRPDLVNAETLPRRWSEVVPYAKALRAKGLWAALAVLNPHGYLVLAALCANRGSPMPDAPGQPIDDRVVREALGDLAQFCALAHPDSLHFNAIDLHDSMTQRADIAYCPLAYGYLTYAEADVPHPLRFSAFPGPQAPHEAGTVLGGTGLGVTQTSRHAALAERFVAMLATEAAQTACIAGHHGQPARLDAWDDPDSDRRFGGAFSQTRATMTTAWMRPRFDGYIPMQDACGKAVERFLQGELDINATINAIATIWNKQTAAA